MIAIRQIEAKTSILGVALRRIHVLYESLERRNLLTHFIEPFLQYNIVSEQVFISWNEITAATSYQIEKLSGASTWEVLALAPAYSDRSVSDPDGNINDVYRFSAIGSSVESSTYEDGLPVESTTFGQIPLQAQITTNNAIEIQWPTDQAFRSNVDYWGIRRREVGDGVFSPIGNELVAAQASYIDITADLGIRYEYELMGYKAGGGQATSASYIIAGRELSAIHHRGNVLLVVDNTQAHLIRSQLNSYKAGLAGDGWSVHEIPVERDALPDTLPAGLLTDYTGNEQNLPLSLIDSTFDSYKTRVAQTKAAIVSVYESVNGGLDAIILVGHVPVPYTGNGQAGEDGHGQTAGAWPTDLYYGIVEPGVTFTDNSYQYNSFLTQGSDSFPYRSKRINFPGDGKFDQSAIGYTAALNSIPVSRIDFSDLPIMYAQTGKTETELLAGYLEKNVEYRLGQWNVTRQAAVSLGLGEGTDPAKFTPLVGFGNTKFNVRFGFDTEVTNGIPAPGSNNHPLHNETWLWAYASGGGSESVLNYDRINQVPRTDMYSTYNFAYPSNGPHHAVFTMIHGSYVGIWDRQNSLLRSAIADPDGWGLTSSWGGRPVSTISSMGLGLPMTQLYTDSFAISGGPRSYGIQGDVTLKQDILKPVSAVQASADGSGVTISWQASPDADGYYVYATDDLDAGFELINTTMITGTTLLDDKTFSLDGMYYMVRATRLETTPSGTYWNLSTGKFSAPTVSATNFRWQDRPHYIDMTFTQDVGASLSESKIIITGSVYDFSTQQSSNVTLVGGAGPDIIPGVTDFTISSYDPGTRTARINFLTTGSRGLSNVLPSGRYTMTFSNQLVSDSNVPVSATPYHFLFLDGDANNDGAIDFSDLVILAQNFGATGIDVGDMGLGDNFSLGDFDNDGDVDSTDMLWLAQNFDLFI